MYSNILIPVSFDEERDTGAAVRAAQALASPGARLTFVHVLDNIPQYVTEIMPAETLAQRRKAVEDLLGQARAGVENAHGIILDGSAGRALVNWAAENDADCIVIASHRPEFSDIFLGSTAAWVVRHAACSVHVLR
ncbi:MAG: universal stress protein [Pseudomonadota bacterium]